MDAVAILSHPTESDDSTASLFNDEEKRLLVLLRYVLIIAAAYLFLFEGKTALPSVSILLVSLALASNVLLSSILKRISLTSTYVGLIVSVDIVWIVVGLWYKGGLEADIYILYFFILLLAAMGQNLKLVVGAGLLLSGVDMTFLATTGNHETIWISSSLIRVPFIFVVSVFYGYIADRVRREHQNTLIEQELVKRMARVVHAQLAELRHSTEELQRSYDHMKKQAAELEKSNQAKDEFLNVVSHELRTPINLISGYAEMIKSKMLGDINSEQDGALIKIKRHTADLLILVNTILETIKVETGSSQLVTRESGLRDFLEGMRQTYDFPSGKEVTLLWDYHADLPVITTDFVKLRHILENLINNAIKFTKAGCVRIAVRHLAEKSAVEFKVADSGIGISSEALPFIFEKFQQGDGSQTRAYGGVGLGLHIVKKYAQLMNASIDVESEINVGSTFTLTLPLLKKDSVKTAHPPSPPLDSSTRRDTTRASVSESS